MTTDMWDKPDTEIAAAMQTSPPVMIGRYRIDGIIGRGAVGTIYRGHDEQIDRAVAIKTIRVDVLADVEDRAGLLRRFAREARSAGRCQHPNIVTVYDFVEHDGAPFIIMEYVPAGTLENVTRSRTQLPLHQVGEIMVQLLSALEHAHGKGVVHRDLKPANILCPAATSIKVTDFGVARLQDLSLTQHGGTGALGTPNYMSPEQFLGRPVDGRSDLFAAGVILFQLLTGAKPFAANDIPELMRKLLNECAPSLSLLRPGLWPHMDDVVQRALARNPTDRYQTAAEFADALNTALERVSEDRAAPLDLTRISSRGPSEQSEGSQSDLSRTMAGRLTTDTLAAIEAALARSIGPIARVVLKRAANEATDTDSLLAALASQIPGDNEATQFRVDAERTLRNDQGIAGAQLEAAISENEIRRATELLLPLIGPVAKVVAEREATTSIGRDDYYEHLARAILDDAERERFLTLAAKKAVRNKG